MHLHNFLVRNSLDDPVGHIQTKDEIFDYDRIDNSIISAAIISDSIRPRGRPSDVSIPSGNQS